MTSESSEETVYCRECGAEIRRAAEICPECGVRQRSPPTSAALESLLDGRNPLVAAVLSAIFPGLGHIYARNIEMGVFFAVAFLIAMASLMVFVGFILVPAVWIYALYDAAKSAERRDEELSSTATR